MLVISPVEPKYLFGKTFKASFEVEENLSSWNSTVFSGTVEKGRFSVGDCVYVMNSNYRIFARGRIKELIGYDEVLDDVEVNTFVSNFEIDTEFPDVDEPLYIVKLDKKHPKDIFVIITRTYDSVFIDYACDLKTAICKFLNRDLVDDGDLEEVWSGLKQVRVQSILSNLNTQGRDVMTYSDRVVELLFLPEDNPME